MNNTIKKPANKWHFTPQLDFKKFILESIKAALYFSAGNMDDMAIAGVDILDSVGVKCSEKKWQNDAWMLIIRSMHTAMANIAKKNKDILPDKINFNDSTFEEALKKFEKAEISIGLDFVKEPEKIGIIEPARTIMHNALQSAGLDTLTSKHLSDRLPSQFILSLREEWIENFENYQLLKDVFSTPFDDRIRRETRWDTYLAFLQTLPKEQAIGAAFGLDKIYIPLRGYVKRELTDEEIHNFEQGKDFQFPPPKTTQIAFDLMTHTEKWLTQDSHLLFIKGGPGCGKSSFSKEFASKMASQGKKVIFIPLQKFNISETFSRAVDNYLNEHHEFERDFGALNEETIIILDGLDEISESGNSGQKAAENFMRYLKKADNPNQKFKIIVTGRTLAIESVERLIPQKEQTINILGYHIHKSEYVNFDKSSQEVINIDQRAIWWGKYFKAKGISPKNAPFFISDNYNYTKTELVAKSAPVELTQKTNTLIEISSQPLLNYLLALALDSGIKISTNTNINTIYEHILNEFNKKYSFIKYDELDITKDEFILFLEEVAICAWQEGKIRRTSWEKITQRCNSADHLNIIQKVMQRCDNFSHMKLLLSFYFGSADRYENGEKAFEFTHKSFGEYLAARGILNQIERVHNASNNKTLDFFLKQWVSIFGTSSIDDDLVTFIKFEIERRSKKDVKKWQQAIINSIEYILTNDFPTYALEGLKTFTEMLQVTRNAEEALFIILNVCAQSTKKHSRIKWAHESSFKKLITRHQGLTSSNAQCRLAQHLTFLDITGQNISRLNLHNANLENAILDKINGKFTILTSSLLNNAIFIKAELHGANFEKSEASEAKFIHANLEKSNLDNVIFTKANFKNSIISKSTLYKTNLTQAKIIKTQATNASFNNSTFEETLIANSNLSGSQFSYTKIKNTYILLSNLSDTIHKGTNFVNSKITRTKLVEAKFRLSRIHNSIFNKSNLQNIDFYSMNLKRVNFTDINFNKANLSQTNLTDVNLQNTNLQNANLQKAYLPHINLENANLQNSNLYRANLFAANIKKANLAGANLESANLMDANLTGANLKMTNLIDAYLEDASVDTANLDLAILDWSEKPQNTIKDDFALALQKR